MTAVVTPSAAAPTAPTPPIPAASYSLTSKSTQAGLASILVAITTGILSVIYPTPGGPPIVPPGYVTAAAILAGLVVLGVVLGEELGRHHITAAAAIADALKGIEFAAGDLGTQVLGHGTALAGSLASVTNMINQGLTMFDPAAQAGQTGNTPVDTALANLATVGEQAQPSAQPPYTQAPVTPASLAQQLLELLATTTPTSTAGAQAMTPPSSLSGAAPTTSAAPT